MDDPSSDGWDTEVYAEKAKKQLQLLGETLLEKGPDETAHLATFAVSSFASEALRPAELTTAFEDKMLRVVRLVVDPVLPGLAASAPDAKALAAMSHQGAEALGAALIEAFAAFADASGVRLKVKVFRVVADGDQIMTRQYLSLSGKKPGGGVIEQHATWDAGWVPDEDEGALRLRWIRLLEFEECESQPETSTLFFDVTASALGGNPVYGEQFLHGMNHWFERIQGHGPDILTANPGLSVGDVNGDGRDDLYVCQEEGLPNRLFIQQADGSALERSAAWGVDWLQASRSSLMVDLDSDGDQDLVVATRAGLVVAENDREETFRVRDVLETGKDVKSLSAADYDLDGRLDIHACVYVDERDLGSKPQSALPSAADGFQPHDANDGARNVLYRNAISETGIWQFEDTTAETGLEVNNHRYSLAASWEDYDNDGDQDLYISNDYGRDQLFRNNAIVVGGRTGKGAFFTDLSDESNAEDSANGMSASWGDYNRDGWMDVLVGNMWSSAGNRITFQSKFRKGSTPEVRERMQRLARGNTLLQNRGDGTFADDSAAAGIEMGRWAWGTNLVDFNNDGWEDVVIANGFITTEDTGDL
ncbi:MAG: VCBS repeat-containing protein [Akkermansiaceae bacterium]|nr:VCBS repeat-containing protein [Akkermansiaceae bacterium]